MGAAPPNNPDLSTPMKTTSAFGLVVPVLYRGLLTAGDWQAMVGQGPLVLEAMGNPRAQAGVQRFEALAQEILCDKRHPAVPALRDHLQLEVLVVKRAMEHETARAESMHCAKVACELVARNPIQFITEA